LVSKQLGELNHKAKIRMFDAENEASSHSLISTIHSTKLPKPSPISSYTCSKGKGSKRKKILDLDSQASMDNLDTPMTTEDECPSPVLPPPTEIVSPAKPTPKATTFSQTQPLPDPQPTSTTPMGPAKMTPTPEPALELTMVLATLQNMKSSLSQEINKVNTWVDQLILNPLGTIPSLQPYKDFGKFALPTLEDHHSDADLARYTTVEDKC
jgi:hypothetical protein